MKGLFLAICLTVAIGMSSVAAVDIRGTVPNSNNPVILHFDMQPQQAVNDVPTSTGSSKLVHGISHVTLESHSTHDPRPQQAVRHEPAPVSPPAQPMEWHFTTQPVNTVTETTPAPMPTGPEDDELAVTSMGRRTDRLSRRSASSSQLPTIPGALSSGGGLLGALPTGRYRRFGDTCAAWPAASQLQCVLNWVISLITEGSQAVPGLTCAGTTPEQQILCIIDWVIMTEVNVVGNITGNFNGTLGNFTNGNITIPGLPTIPGLSGLPGLIQGCASAAPVRRLSCITSWVLAQQGNPGLVVGNTCAAFPPGIAQQTCINLWVNFQKCGSSASPECSCLSLATADIQQCINDWVIKTQQLLDPSAAGSCISVGSGLQLACINSWVLNQQAQNPYEPFPFSCSEFETKALKRYCKNACIIGQQLKDTNGDVTNTCAAIDPSEPLQVASCVTAYLKTGIYNNCKS